MKKVTVPALREMKARGEKIAMLTAYDFTWGAIADEAGIDVVLVGDTLGMVVQGKETTLPVTLEEMIYHGEMVARGVRRALVVVDLPFLSYHVSPQQGVEAGGRVLKETNASAVKLEGGTEQAKTIERMVDAGIPVMAHVGLRPQSVRNLGGMSKIQRDTEQLLIDARACEEAGAFAIVLELIPNAAAAELTQALNIPTIGIGAGVNCDGQVLVGPDMLGLNPGFHPKFLKLYAELRKQAHEGIEAYVREVKASEFPDAEHSHE